ncbi:DUF1186 domain-containing protein [Nostoc sp. UHCC 0302]|uniref:DUF1186 domain-containing protein n=1 Tax=Nostoc sp. UHCC 0302 TaxID=3134896 RepID=UPI00311CDEBF
MQLEEILSELENNTGKFPRLALERAIEERSAITPVLLTTLEKLSNNLEELLEKEEYILHVYALYLLAQFREALAYPVIIKFFSVGDISLDVTGDIVTEDLCRILASVSNGNIEPIKELIENQKANEYVRDAAIESLLVLVAQEVISREEVIQYYEELFSKAIEDETGYIWTNLVSYSAKLCAVELREHIDKAFEKDLVDEFFINQEDVNEYFEQGREAAFNQLRDNLHYSFIEDVISEMENWVCFYQEKPQDLDYRLIAPEDFILPKPKKSKAQVKKKRKMQSQSRRKNRSKKK